MDGEQRGAGLQVRLGYCFQEPRLLEAALTHRSYRFEHPDIDQDNERLEFLGDAILGFLSAEYLYQAFPGGDEGRLTALRSRMTSGKTLAACARALGVGEHLLMGQGEARTGGCGRTSNLANAMEALMAAVYLDGGMAAAGAVFKVAIVDRVGNLDVDPWADNPKGKLQELVQARWKQSPRYTVMKEEGLAHVRHYTVRLSLPDGTEGFGEGSSKQAAEADAAQAILARGLAGVAESPVAELPVAESRVDKAGGDVVVS